MQNQSSPQNTPDNSTETEPAVSRRERRALRARRGWRKGPVIAAGAVVAVGALVGSGFMLQSAVAAQNERIAATAELSAATDLKIEQLGSHSNILEARAVKTAKDTLSGAKDTITAAKGKADAGQLASSVAALDNYRLLAPERVFELANATETHTTQVKQAIAKADKIAAEKKAAAEAAARAAAEKAAAEEAAAAEEEESSSGGGSRPSGPANPGGAQAIARDMLAARGWGDDQFGCLVALWDRESGWNVYASNPSGAYGIPQALPGSKMSSAGADWESNPATQIAWGLGYIADRYGSPCGAWDQSESAGWY